MEKNLATKNMASCVFGDIPADDVDEWAYVEHYMEPIMKYYLDPSVTDIMVNRYDSIFINKNGENIAVDEVFDNERHVETLIQQFAHAVGQPPPTDDVPSLDARFPDHSRVCATTKAISPSGSTMTIRVAPKVHLKPKDLIGFGALSQEMMDYLEIKTKEGANILVSGTTGSGKTTLLRVISSFIEQSERVITCEDTQELYIDLPNFIPREAPKRIKGYDLSDLVFVTLRDLPDRIMVGEIRSARAAMAFLEAINTGHRGCATTLHANSAKDAIRRIQDLIASEGLLDYNLIEKHLLSSVDVIIQAVRSPVFGRKITEICAVSPDGLCSMFKYDINSNRHIRVSDE